MRYIACAALLALLTVVGCDQSTGSSGVAAGSGTPAALTITTTSIPGFIVPGAPGVPMPSYSATISATGGSGTYSWSVVAGTLPAGLNISPTGTPDTTITGTMTSPATTAFTVQVADSSSATATMAYTLVVNYAPTPPPGTPPTFYNQNASGRTLFICDVSGATNGQPLANLQSELSAAIGGMSTSDEFDIMVFNSAISGYVSMMWGSTLPATTSNVSSANAWINGANFVAAGSPDTACHAALQASFAVYTGIDNAFLFTWTGPADASNILSDYPSWAASDPNRYLTVIAKNSAGNTFGQQLAATAGGTFVP